MENSLRVDISLANNTSGQCKVDIQLVLESGTMDDQEVGRLLLQVTTGP